MNKDYNLIDKVKKLGFWTRLMTNNSGLSSKNFFLVAITIVGIVLLMVPIFVLVIEAYYNHTISTDMQGMAAYITAVAAIFASGGITKAWSDWGEYKFRDANKNGIPDNLENNLETQDDGGIPEEN